MVAESVTSDEDYRADEQRTITDVIDDLGCGFAQVRIALFGGGINYTNGLCIETMAILPKAIAADLGWHRYERASVYTAALVGKLTGNFSAVIVNTSMGRRLPIMIGYFLGTMFITMSAFVYNVYIMALCWCIVGFSMGFAGPNLWSLITEASPTNRRMPINAFAMCLFSVGALVAFVTAYYFDPNLKFGKDWRNVILWQQPSNVALLVTAVLVGFVDSAHAYAAKGNNTEATRILEAMRQQNGRPEVSVAFEIEHGNLATETWMESLVTGLRTMFNQKYVLITTVMFMLTFTLNFVSYGMSYAIPIVLSELDLGLSAITVMIMSELLMVLGYASAAFLGRTLGRRITIIGPFLACSAIIFMTMAYGLYRLDNTKTGTLGSFSSTMVLGAAMSWKFIMAHGWMVVYVYATEVFPTVCRSSAVGLVLGMGRLGSVSTAYVFEGLHEYTGTHATFFYVVSAMMVLDAIGSFLVLPETKGKKLQLFSEDANASENTPLKKT